MVEYTSGSKRPRPSSGTYQVFGDPSRPHLQFQNQSIADFSAQAFLIPLEIDFPYMGNSYNKVTWKTSGQFTFGPTYQRTTSQEVEHPTIKLNRNGSAVTELHVEYGTNWVRFCLSINLKNPLFDGHVINGTDHRMELVLYDDGTVEIRHPEVNSSLTYGKIGDSSSEMDILYDDFGTSVVLIPQSGSENPYEAHDAYVTDGPDPLPVSEIKSWSYETSQDAEFPRYTRGYVYDSAVDGVSTEVPQLRMAVTDSDQAIIPTSSMGNGDTGIGVHTNSGDKEIDEYAYYQNESHYIPIHFRQPGRGNAGENDNQGDWEWSFNTSAVEDYTRFDVDNGAWWSVSYPVFTDGSGNVISLDNVDYIRIGTSFNETTSQARDWYFHLRDDSGNWNEQVLRQSWPANQEYVIWETTVPSMNITGAAWCMHDYYDENRSTYFDTSPVEDGKVFGAYREGTFDVGY